MNSIQIVGRLTKDPETSVTQSGKSLTCLDIAVSRPFSDNQTDYFKVVGFGKTAEHWAKYLSKGSQVAVVGYMQNNRFETKDGIKRDNWQIIASQLEFLTKISKNSNSKNEKQKEKEEESVKEDLEPVEDKDSDMPF